MQALVAFELGDQGEAVACAQEALTVANTGGDASERGGPLLILGNVALMTGDNARAQELYDEAIEVHRRVGEKWGLSMTLSIAAGLRIVREDFEQARAQASEAMLLCEELEDPRGIAWTLDMFAALLAAEGHNDGAARLWGASDALLESTGGSLAPIVSRIRDHYLEPVQAALGGESFASAFGEGRAMLPADAIALARSSNS
jgi:tetratricopeptide (TPR) repeat protein